MPGTIRRISTSNTPVGDIPMIADPTLRPGEFRWKHDKERTMRADAIKLADEFRQSLGFRTWPAQADYARSAGNYPRRSGRTARGLLDVIARCVAHNCRVLHIVPTGVIACADYCASMARDFIAKLRLDIRVEVETDHPNRVRPSPAHYFDHYQIEFQRRSDERVWQRDIREHTDHGFRLRAGFLAQPVAKAKTTPYRIEPAELPPRPDGFAQSAIDAAKVAMLAVVPRRFK